MRQVWLAGDIRKAVFALFFRDSATIVKVLDTLFLSQFSPGTGLALSPTSKFTKGENRRW
jgi:hypothetical protein